MSPVLVTASLIGFLVPVIGRGWARRRGQEPGWLSHPAWAYGSAALVAIALVVMGWSLKQWPMVTIQGGLQTLALLVSVGWIGLRRRERMEAAGAILLSLTVLLLTASLVEPPPMVGELGSSPFFLVHFTLIFLGLAAFALSFSLSALFLIERRRLKRKLLEGIGELPSLDTLDRLNFQTQAFGFVALTAGIAMGIFLATASTASERGVSDLTVWGTGAVWLWYAIGLHARLFAGWRGKMAAVFGVVGFGGLGAVLVIAMVLLGGWHGA